LSHIFILWQTDGATFLAGIIYHKSGNFLANILFLVLSMVMVCCVFDTKSMKISKHYLSEIWKIWPLKLIMKTRVAGKAVGKKGNG
jgi:hypothetical protein